MRTIPLEISAMRLSTDLNLPRHQYHHKLCAPANSRSDHYNVCDVQHGPRTTGASGPISDSMSMGLRHLRATDARPHRRSGPRRIMSTIRRRSVHRRLRPSPSSQRMTGRWTKNTLDGFGRTVRRKLGSSSTKSVSETVYDPCACSALGKTAHANDGRRSRSEFRQQLTTYTYDRNRERTLSVATVGSDTQEPAPTLYVRVLRPLPRCDRVLQETTNIWSPDAFNDLIAVSEPPRQRTERFGDLLLLRSARSLELLVYGAHCGDANHAALPTAANNLLSATNPETAPSPTPTTPTKGRNEKRTRRPANRLHL